METVLESEEQDRGGETQEDQEEEEEKKEEEEEEALGDSPASAPHLLLSDSSRINSPAETRLLALAHSFQRQYSHLFPERRPLLLCPVNECGVKVKKFVSVTIRPTPPLHPELSTWQGCASFVANFLSLEPLEPPVDLPSFLFSPPSVLRSGRGTIFELCTLLCSLLLGADYQAYCVSGYASREMCVGDQSLQERPLLDTELQAQDSEQEAQEEKYSMEPVKELRSDFIQQERRRQAEAADLQEQEQESERRPADVLHGLRLHCWVLVLSGSRGVRHHFFIDPLTGRRFPTADRHFLGVESAWNHRNYYVNMQECRRGCTDMVFDLEDSSLWEPFLLDTSSTRKESQPTSKHSRKKQEEEIRSRGFQMPRSWVSSISISKEDLETGWPGGAKVTRYRKAKLEEFEPNLRADGLVTQLTTYRDLDCTQVVAVKSWYKHRNDHLEEREVNEEEKFTAERFTPGRRFHLLFLRSRSPGSGPEQEMAFSRTRLDGLRRRRLTSPADMTETFQGRHDFLYERRVLYDRNAVHFTGTETEGDGRRPQKVVERFHRNRSKAAEEDVAERAFLLAERRIEVTYHAEDDRWVPSRRSFIKPRGSTEVNKEEDFTADMVSSFQVGVCEERSQTVSLYQMFVSLMKDEEEVLLQIEASQREVRDIMACRAQEELHLELHFSPWTTTGAARAHSLRLDMERAAAEERRWLQEKEEDVLAPLMIRLKGSGPLSPEDARRLHRDCLSLFTQRLVEGANLIQERYDRETQDLQKKQLWYQRKQPGMEKQEEDEYQAYCAEKTLQIQVARKRLIMHKEAARRKYVLLDQKLKQDPRLAPHLLS